MSTGVYDDMGEAYAAHSAANPWNELYDRPAMLALAGDVTGKRVLDVGSAAGYLSGQLVARGAKVVGVDRSPVMVEYARLHWEADFHCADLAEPLDFLEDGSFDLVTASLVMHYLEDWGPALAELRRVLVPGGALVMSVHHPEGWHWFQLADYFKTQLLTDHWPVAGETMEVQFYHRPLGAMFAALRHAGSGWTTSWSRCRCPSARPPTRRRTGCWRRSRGSCTSAPSTPDQVARS